MNKNSEFIQKQERRFYFWQSQIQKVYMGLLHNLKKTDPYVIAFTKKKKKKKVKQINKNC